MKNYHDLKGNDRIRLEYIYNCQKEINDLGKPMNLQDYKLVQYLKKEVQKNLNSLGK